MFAYQGRHRRLNWRTGLSATVSAGLVLGAAVALTAAVGSADAAVSPVATRNANMVTADALPTVQIDGVAWKQLIVGGTVYVGGEFKTARPAGAAAGVNTSTRSNFLAYNLATGVLDTSFAPAFNAQVRALAVSPDHKTLYVGGDFTMASGSTRSRIAAYDLTTGTLISSFKPAMGSTVYSIVATATTVYAGGTFTTAAGVTRHRLAAFTSAGALTSWNPSADAKVSAMVLAPDGSRLIVGGSFATIGTTTSRGSASIAAATGAVQPWAVNALIQDYGSNAAIDALSTDGTSIFGSGFAFSTDTGNFEGTFSANPSTGAINWIESCHGDTLGNYPSTSAGVIYTVSHAHNCNDVGGFGQTDTPWFHYHSLAFTLNATGTAQHNYDGGHYKDYFGQPTPSLVGDWLPDTLSGTYTQQGQAAWDITGNDQYVIEGGEFPVVNGQAQYGLVRYAISSIAPNKQGPRVNSTAFVPNVTQASATSAHLSFESNWDRDDTSLTYQIVRNGTVVATVAGNSLYWNRPMLGYTDTGLTPGTTYSYAVNALDPDGNVAHGAAVSFTQPSTAPPAQSAYAARVISDGAGPYWPLSEPSSRTFFDDAAGDDDALPTGTPTGGTAGPVAGTTATTFDGVYDTTAKTGDGAYQESTSQFGPNVFTIESWFKTTSTKNGEIVGFGGKTTGLSQFADRLVYLNSSGKLVFLVRPTTSIGSMPQRTITTSAAYNNGAWHQVVATLSSAGMVLYVDGVQKAASASTTSAQNNYPGFWRVGGDDVTGSTTPTPSFFAGSIGQVSIYPTALSSSQISQHYSLATAGGGGGTNGAPTAAFTSSTSGLTASFNAGGSTAGSGSTISSYAWNFGDGATATGVTTSHPYASASTYTVTLTVTDADGQTSTVSHPVTVSTSSTLAADAFGRTVSSGWGSADAGGAWTPTGTASNFAVSSGVGTMTQKAGGIPLESLTTLSLTDTDSTVDVSIDKVPTGSSASDSLYLGARRSGTSEYELRARVLTGGSVQVALVKNTSGTAKQLTTVTLTGLTYTASTVLHLRFVVTGSSSVTLQGKVWTGTTQPSAWTTTTTDSTAPFASGAPSVSSYLTTSATNAPITSKWDNLSVVSA